MATIRERYEDISRRLREHDAARKILKAELLALQHVCPHAHVKEWTHTDYVGDTDHYWLCEDCGLQRRT